MEVTGLESTMRAQREVHNYNTMKVPQLETPVLLTHRMGLELEDMGKTFEHLTLQRINPRC